MIELKYDANLKDKGVKSRLTYSHKESNTLEVEFLIAHLINVIKKNDKNMKDGQIIKDVRSILKEINNQDKKKGKDINE